MHSSDGYVHGYSAQEAIRLSDQARTLSAILHSDVFFPAGSTVLEAGCGTGAQTIMLAKNNPDVHFISMDISPESLNQAQARVEKEGLTNVAFKQGSIFNLIFEQNSFDHVFVCFVLEHLDNPLLGLKSLVRVLRPGGTLTAIEGDHGSAYFYPDSIYAARAIQCLVDLQAQAGGDAMIGRRLYPLLTESGLIHVKVRPCVIYVDSSRSELVDGFTRKTFTAMIEGVEKMVLDKGWMTEPDWRRAIADLYRTSEPDGVFNYMFFKAKGIKSE